MSLRPQRHIPTIEPLIEYTPSMCELDSPEGGHALDWELAVQEIAKLTAAIDQLYHHKASAPDKLNALLDDANNAWCSYNHAEPEDYERFEDDRDILKAEVYDCIRKAYIDGYMVGFQLRISGQRYSDG
jgi:hypothetical protein